MNDVDSKISHIRDEIFNPTNDRRAGSLLEGKAEGGGLTLCEPYIDIIDGHSERVTCIDFNIESGTVASGSVDKNVKVWSLENNECICTLSGHFDVIKTLQITDNIIISGSSDRTMRLWDMSGVFPNLDGSHDPDRKVSSTRIFRGHTGKVTCLMFDNKWLLSGSYDGTIRQWDLETGKVVTIMGCQHDTVSTHTKIPDIAEKYDSYKGIWSVNSQQEKPENSQSHIFDDSKYFYQTYDTEVQNTSPVNSLQFCGPALVSAHDDGAIKLWDIRSGGCHDTLFGHLGPVQTLKLDLNAIVTGGTDGTVRIWDIRRKDQAEIFELWYGVNSVSIDSSRIFAAVKNINIKVHGAVLIP